MNLPLTPVRFLRYSEQQFPRKTAVVCQDLRFTYAEFGNRVARRRREGGRSRGVSQLELPSATGSLLRSSGGGLHFASAQYSPGGAGAYLHSERFGSDVAVPGTRVCRSGGFVPARLAHGALISPT